MRWPVAPLVDAMASARVFVDGDWVESKDQDPEGDVRLVQLADVGDGEYIDKSDRYLTNAKALALRCTFLEPGDVLVARMPDPLGRACIFPGASKRCVTVVDVCIIRPDAQKHHARWLMHCLNAPSCRNQIAGYATGTTRSRISRGNLGRVKIPSLPLSEQRRIVEILDKSDALRAKRRVALAQLDTLTQSIFLDMFGDPATNPKGIQKSPLGDLIRLKSGDFLPASEMAPDGAYPVLGGNGISGFHDRYMFEEPQIVIGRVGVYCGCVHAAPQKSWITDNALFVSERDPALRFEYLVHALTHARLNQYASQSGQPLVSGSRIYPVEIVLPPEELQISFEERIAGVKEVERHCDAGRASLDCLFASLQHRAFRGEL